MTLRTVSAVAFGVALLTAASPAAAAPSSAQASGATIVAGAAAGGPMRVLSPLAGTTAPLAGDPVPEVEVTEMDVVVPAVEPSGDLVTTPEVLEAQTEPDVIVTDEVVAVDRVESAVVETDQFQTLGVTWPADAAVDDLGLEVRTRVDGQWSEWTALEPADDGPDAGTVDAGREVRGGTDALSVGDSDAVQLAFAATVESGPDGLSLALIGSQEVAVAPNDAIVGAPQPDAETVSYLTARASAETVAVVPATVVTGTVKTASSPTVITRGQWGARDQVCAPDVASNLVGAVVHHTAGSNSYKTVAEAMAQIRRDQAYHIDGRGWCDIGYNFIVDKWGNIYEGRANSLTKPVIGVHAGGFNTGTVGVSMLGDYSTVSPPAVTQQAVAQIIGWRLGAYGINPEGSMSYYTYGGENSRFPAGTTVPLPRVFGHRDVAYTACPGQSGFAMLPTVRQRAASFSYDERFRQANAVVRAMYADILGRGVDPSGLETWSAMLAGGSGLPALVATLTDSDEYIRLRIRQAYVEVLGREPEGPGMLSWQLAIRGGAATVDDVQRQFLSSAEFLTRAGGTNEGYVQRMYESVLGRSPGASETTYWAGQIGQYGRERVTDAIWFSMEAARHRAGTYYQTFLKRAPDLAGQANWATVLLTSGEGAVRIGIAGSEEYRRLAMVRYP